MSGVFSIVFTVTLGDMQPVCTSGATLTTHCASVETLNLCHISLSQTIVQSTSLKVVLQLYTPLPILPESGCAEFTAYAKERRLVSIAPTDASYHQQLFIQLLILASEVDSPNISYTWLVCSLRELFLSGVASIL